MSVADALKILSHKPAAAPRRDADDNAGMSEAEVKALRAKIIDKLERFKAINDREKREAGWTEDGEHWIPPGWVKAQP